MLSKISLHQTHLAPGTEKEPNPDGGLDLSIELHAWSTGPREAGNVLS